jgi:transposase
MRLERDLLSAGQRVVRVPPLSMARTPAPRRVPGEVGSHRCIGGGTRGLREPDLPVAGHDEVSREFKLLVDRREDLVSHRTAVTPHFR